MKRLAEQHSLIRIDYNKAPVTDLARLDARRLRLTLAPQLILPHTGSGSHWSDERLHAVINAEQLQYRAEMTGP